MPRQPRRDLGLLPGTTTQKQRALPLVHLPSPARIEAFLRRHAILVLLLIVVSAVGIWSLVWHSPGAHDSVAQALPQLFPSATPSPTSTPTTAERVAISLAKADQAWQAKELDEAIAVLENAYALQANHPQVTHRLSIAYAALGLDLVDKGNLEDAIPYFDRALALRPDEARVQEARDLAQRYLEAVRSLKQSAWEPAIVQFGQIYRDSPDYQDTRYNLYRAHYEQGLALQSKGLLKEAKAEYQRALEIVPEDRDARLQLHEVNYILTPPTPTATATPTATPTPTHPPAPPQRIVVDVSEQRFRVYEDGALKWDWVCSTGRHGSATRRGTFHILDKIPNAWGGTWSIWMPYWLGIYWAGGTENGIHGLPVSQSGVAMWAGYLGTPISFGCIVLDTWAARQLYEWVNIGTPVAIVD